MPRWTWTPPLLFAGVALLLVHVPTLIHAYFWPQWEWGLAARSLILIPGFLGTPILVGLTFYAIFRIALPDWSRVGAVGLALLLYFVVGIGFMISLGSWFSGGLLAFFQSNSLPGVLFNFVLEWPAWWTRIGTCSWESSLCLFD